MTASKNDDGLLLGVPIRDPDAELHWRQDGDRRKAIVKQRRHRKYFALSAAYAKIWTLCDGRRSVSDIAEQVVHLGGPRDVQVIADIIRHMAATGMLRLSTAAPVADRVEPERGIAATCRRILTYRVDIEGVDSFAGSLYRLVGRRAFHGPAKFLLAGILFAGLAVFLHAWLSGRSMAVPTNASLWLLPPFVLTCMILHEAAHALAVKHCGREVIAIGLGWFWVGPFFFVDTSDMWLAGRRERILVSLAGPIADLVIAGLLALASLLLPPQLASLALFGAAIRYLTVLLCLTPFLEYDGYYALCDLLNRPNLRRDAFSWLFDEFRPTLAALATAAAHRRTELFYALGSLLYLVFLVTLNAFANHAFFASLFREDRQAWFVGPLVWVITLSLLAFFLAGLMSDLSQLRRPARRAY